MKGSLVGSVSFYYTGARGLDAPLANRLKAESSLQFDRAATQSSSSHAELRVTNGAVDVGEVLVIEQVVEVSPKFELGVFTENGHLRQTESLAESGIYVFVARPLERVALDTRRLRSTRADLRERQSTSCVCRLCEVAAAAIREVGSCLQEGRVAVVGPRSTRIGGGKQL